MDVQISYSLWSEILQKNYLQRVKKKHTENNSRPVQTKRHRNSEGA